MNTPFGHMSLGANNQPLGSQISNPKIPDPTFLSARNAVNMRNNAGMSLGTGGQPLSAELGALHSKYPDPVDPLMGKIQAQHQIQSFKPTPTQATMPLLTKNSFFNGFIKRAKEYGYNFAQAENIFKVAGNITPQQMDDWGRSNALDQSQPSTPLPTPQGSSYGPDNIVGNPALMGALFGGGLGAISGGEDENHQTHHMRNALLGALAGGGAGVLGKGLFDVGKAYQGNPNAGLMDAFKQFHV